MSYSHTSADRTWRVSDTDDILWAEWDNNFIAFHRPSGKTHLLNAASEALLTRILIQPKSAADIARELSSGEREPVDEEILEEIDAMLIRLEELGLVVRS